MQHLPAHIAHALDRLGVVPVKTQPQQTAPDRPAWGGKGEPPF